MNEKNTNYFQSNGTLSNLKRDANGGVENTANKSGRKQTLDGVDLKVTIIETLGPKGSLGH